MTANEFKASIEDKIPSKYIYISRNMYTVKGVPIYIIYFNSRIPNSKISLSSINQQHALKVQGLFGNTSKSLEFDNPILLDEYSKEIRPNSIVIFADLAGNYISKPNLL
jgi:hypothetical protein